MLALKIIFHILFWPSFFVGCYWALMFIIGMILHKQKYPMVADQKKFVIFVPCHNEAAVIGATVENLAKINYNPALLDVYFIADNCSDRTADAIRETIAKLGKPNYAVLERNVPDLDKRGKPHAIRWGIDYLEANGGFYDKYEMFMIVDADNFVDADILKHVNSQYLSIKEKKRPVMIQTYLDCKNSKNFIARGYWASYRISNGFYLLPKSKIGLPVAIGGTGFAIDTKFLQSIGGFNCRSLTEDLEIQTIAIERGKTTKFNVNARIYDEKPTSAKASLIQKTRWSQGHWYCFFRYFLRLFIGLFNPKQIKYIPHKLDQMLYLASNLFLISFVPLNVINIIFVFNGIILLPTFIFPIGITAMILSILMIPIASLYDGNKQEKKWALLLMIPNYLAVLFAGAIYIVAATVGLFKCANQKVWRKTVHKITVLDTKHNEEKGVVLEQNGQSEPSEQNGQDEQN